MKDIEQAIADTLKKQNKSPADIVTLNLDSKCKSTHVKASFRDCCRRSVSTFPFGKSPRVAPVRTVHQPPKHGSPAPCRTNTQHLFASTRSKPIHTMLRTLTPALHNLLTPFLSLRA